MSSYSYFIIFHYYSCAPGALSPVECSSVTIDSLFALWKGWSFGWLTLGVIVAAGFFLPSVFLISVEMKRSEKQQFWGAIVMMIIGILIASAVVETGPRRAHGNFFWQIVYANVILYTVVARIFMSAVATGRMRSFSLYLLAFLYAWILVTGLFYLLKLLITGNIL